MTGLHHKMFVCISRRRMSYIISTNTLGLSNLMTTSFVGLYMYHHFYSMMWSAYSLLSAMLCMLHHVYDVLRQVPLQQSHDKTLVGLVAIFVRVVVMIIHFFASAELGGIFVLYCFLQAVLRLSVFRQVSFYHLCLSHTLCISCIFNYHVSVFLF